MKLADIVKPDTQNTVYMTVKAIPRAVKTEAIGVMDDGTIKIRVAAVPEGGNANSELIRYIARELTISGSRIEIIAGAGDTRKMIRIRKI